MLIRDYYVPIPPHLSDVLADLANVSKDADFETIINRGRTLLFNFSYPVSIADKADLENYILNYYIMRRIGSGNVRKWRQMLKGKMLEIMPYYKQLLDSEKLQFEPLQNNDITTTDDAADTLDRTTDKRTDNDYSYEKSGTEDVENRELQNTTGQYSKTGKETIEKDGTIAETGSGTRDVTENTETDGTIAETGSGTRNVTENTEADGTKAETGSYTKSGNETTHNTEINRYSDTPQGDSSRIWEIDAQGRPALTDIYLTDVRGITNDGTRQYSESGSDTKNTTTHDEAEKTLDEDTTSTKNTTTHDEAEKTLDEDTTSTKNTTTHDESERNYQESGTETGHMDDIRTTDREWTEAGEDQRDIIEHETVDQDTTHENTNVRIGVANQSKSSLLNEYRETFLRIYQMITEELEPLFYNLVEIDDILDYV